MKKVISSLIFILIFIFHFPFLPSFIPKVFAEKINSFDSQIEINTDGTIDVQEKITYDFENIEKHGIYRTIPLVRTLNNKRYEMTIDIISITDAENNIYRYQLINKPGNTYIKIGDANKMVTGSRDYVLKYKVFGAIGYYQSFDELYWNVTGNDWEIPIDKISTRIFFKPVNNIEGDKKYSVRCFGGKLNSTGGDCQTRLVGNEWLVSSKKMYSSKEGFTIAFKFPKNLVKTLLPKEKLSLRDSLRESWQSRYNDSPILWSVLLFGLGILIVFWYVVYPIKIFLNWWKNGRDPSASSGQVYLSAWFDPPKLNKRFLSPEEAGTIIDESADEKDISAMIIFLAQQGHLIIKEYESEKFKLIKKNSKKVLSNYQKYFLDSVFTDSNELDLDTENIADTCQKTKDQIYESMTTEGLFVKNPNKIRNYYYVIIVLAVFTLNIPLLLSAIIFGLNMVKRTVTGVRLKFEALSLKNFMKSQDRQLEFQAKNQMYFEKLLPYAIAFGIEKIWIKRFEKIHFKNPDWYQSNSTFTNYMFVNSLHSSLSVSTMPDTSSGSASGFSGGGGGGGGGGSW